MIYDRRSKQLIEEKVLGGRFIDLAYGSRAGRAVVGFPGLDRVLSRAVGVYQRSSFSRAQVARFMRDYDIVASDFLSPEKGFASFDEFFIRALRPGARRFPAEPKHLGSPAEGRLTVFELSSPQVSLTVKGQGLSLAALLGSEARAEAALGGWAFVFRLCPIDYHRFHFPDGGTPGPSLRLPGRLRSVNPRALEAYPEIFCENERQLCEFQSEHFGKLFLMEVGAMCVGRIHQTYEAGRRVERGAEKGYFSFGGSTVILIAPPSSKLRPDEDIVEKSREGVECLVRLGETVALRS